MTVLMKNPFDHKWLYMLSVLGKVTFKSNALQYALLPKKVTNYVT